MESPSQLSILLMEALEITRGRLEVEEKKRRAAEEAQTEIAAHLLQTLQEIEGDGGKLRAAKRGLAEVSGHLLQSLREGEEDAEALRNANRLLHRSHAELMNEVNLLQEKSETCDLRKTIVEKLRRRLRHSELRLHKAYGPLWALQQGRRHK